jgi:hypothetical protein
MPSPFLAAWRGTLAFAGLLRVAVFDPDSLWPLLAATPGKRKLLAAALIGTPLIMPASLLAGVSWRSASAPTAGQVSPMAVDSPMASLLAVHFFPPQLAGMAVAPRSVGEIAVAAFAAYGSAIAIVLGTAATIWLLARISGVRSDAAGCLQVAIWGSQPFWLSCAGLAHPSLLPLLAVGLLHSCCVTHSGVCRRLGATSSDGAALLGIVALAMLVLAPLASYLASALLGAAIRLAG